MLLFTGPSAPQSLKWSQSGPGEVELRWLPPRHPNGVIVAYVILYGVASPEPEMMWLIKKENGEIHTYIHVYIHVLR